MLLGAARDDNHSGYGLELRGKNPERVRRHRCPPTRSGGSWPRQRRASGPRYRPRHPGSAVPQDRGRQCVLVARRQSSALRRNLQVRQVDFGSGGCTQAVESCARPRRASTSAGGASPPDTSAAAKGNRSALPCCGESVAATLALAVVSGHANDAAARRRAMH